jgi:hypothetical protein
VLYEIWRDKQVDTRGRERGETREEEEEKKETKLQGKERKVTLLSLSLLTHTLSPLCPYSVSVTLSQRSIASADVLSPQSYYRIIVERKRAWAAAAPLTDL